MATPKKTKSTKPKTPDFPQTMYVTTNTFDPDFYHCDPCYDEGLIENQEYVAVYVLDKVQRVNYVPQTITLENL